MFNKVKNNFPTVFIEIFLIYLGFWFLLKSLSTNGIWETVILNVLFFLLLPGIFLGKNLKNLNKKSISQWKIWVQVVLLWGGFFFLLYYFNNAVSFLKLNPLSRTDWFIGDWWVIIFIDLILIPIVLFSQEFFFRDFLIKKLKLFFSIGVTLTIQAGLFVIFEVLYFESFSWQFMAFNFIFSLILGWFYFQTKSVWYSFMARWVTILILDGFILYKIQQIKS